MGSPLSSAMAEIYLQYLEEMSIKHWLETTNIICYRRYVDDILIISDHTRTDETTTHSILNLIHPCLQFTPILEQNNTITYLDLTIHRLTQNLQLGIFHKPTQTDTTIHFNSNHPTNHKSAAYYSHIRRMLSFPITEQARCREWNLISKMAINNGFPLRIICKIQNAIAQPRTSPGTFPEVTRRIWVPFT
jgi:hypothetical protein